MRLKYDPDFQRELETLVSSTKRKGEAVGWVHVVAAAIVLAATIFLLWYWQAPPGLMVSVTIAVATVCVVATFNAAVTVVHGSLTVVVATLEWFGKKSLGEVEET